MLPPTLLIPRLSTLLLQLFRATDVDEITGTGVKQICRLPDATIILHPAALRSTFLNPKHRHQQIIPSWSSPPQPPNGHP